MTHVLQKPSTGYRIANEEACLVVSMMRGGDPLALGVSDAMPLAMYLHAKVPSDIEARHLKGRKTILLVDFVINTAQSIGTMIKHVHELDKIICIIVLAGVIQADSINRKGQLHRLGRHVNFTVIGLRTSRTKFKGAGANDTGNRLFNTTHLDYASTKCYDNI